MRIHNFVFYIQLLIVSPLGRQFDKNGNLQQWWSNEVIQKFKARAQCIIDQYGNYTVPEIGLNVRSSPFILAQNNCKITHILHKQMFHKKMGGK